MIWNNGCTRAKAGGGETKGVITPRLGGYVNVLLKVIDESSDASLEAIVTAIGRIAP